MKDKTLVLMRDLKAGSLFYSRETKDGPWVLWVKTLHIDGSGKKATYRCICLTDTVDDVWWEAKDEVVLAFTLKEFKELARKTRYEQNKLDSEGAS